MDLQESISIILPLITGFGSFFCSYVMATKKSKQELKSLEESNKHDIDKLMKQHEIDIESIKEKHKLEMEKTESDHKNKIEIMEIQHNNEMERKAREIEDTAKFGVIEQAFNNPQTMKAFLNLMNDPQIQKHTRK